MSIEEEYLELCNSREYAIHLLGTLAMNYTKAKDDKSRKHILGIMIEATAIVDTIDSSQLSLAEKVNVETVFNALNG